jgi:hypothetical protein
MRPGQAAAAAVREAHALQAAAVRILGSSSGRGSKYAPLSEGMRRPCDTVRLELMYAGYRMTRCRDKGVRMVGAVRV